MSINQSMILLLLLVSPVSADDVSVADIQHAWRTRANEYPQGTVRWTEERLIAKGGISATGTAGFGYGGDDSPIPLDDTVHTMERRFVFKGDKARYTEVEPVWSVAREAFNMTERIVAFDGRNARTLYSSKNAAGPITDRGIVSNQHNDVLKYWSLLPVRVFFRPPTGQEGEVDPVRLKSLAVTNRVAEIGGFTCVSLSDPNDSYRIWVTTEFGYLLTKVETLDQGITVLSLDIEYDMATKLPESWVSNEKHVDGTLKRRTIARIDEIDLAEDISDDHFVLKFPTNTLVRDRTATRKMNSYIEQADGRKTAINMESIESADDYIAIRDGDSSMSRFLPWGVAVALAAAGVVLFISRWRAYVRK